MTDARKKVEAQVQREISASPEAVFDAWFDHKVPGNPWNIADKFILDRKVDGLFYWSMKDDAHYGRFLSITRPALVQKTWVSRSTYGEESQVTITFEKQGENTLMRIVHSGLPDKDSGRKHEQGWTYFLDIFLEQFGRIK